jgi:hypothetical protein
MGAESRDAKAARIMRAMAPRRGRGGDPRAAPTPSMRGTARAGPRAPDPPIRDQARPVSNSPARARPISAAVSLTP